MEVEGGVRADYCLESVEISQYHGIGDDSEA